MGIRYIAISIDQQDFDHLSEGTCKHCGEEPTLRELDCGEDALRETLDLDKSWGYFQRVLAAEPQRPAAALVSGRVTDMPWGWRSHKGLLSPDEVAAVADDLASVSDELVRERLLAGPGVDDRTERDIAYVCHFLPEAQAFTRRVADANRAILYYIG